MNTNDRKNRTSSTIIASHNRAYTTGLAIESTLGQTYQVCELVVTHESSSDYTTAHLIWLTPFRYKNKIRRDIAWIENVVLRNTAVETSKGPCVVFQDKGQYSENTIRR